MTILADWQINELARKGMLVPYVDHKVSQRDGRKVLSYGLEPFGYTLTLSPSFKRPMHTGEPTFVGVTSQHWIEEHAMVKHGRQWVIVPPNDFVLAVSNELITLPADVQGQCLTKSTIARDGGFANITWLDAGWSGHLTIEIANLGRNPLHLPVNEGVCQIVFHRGELPTKPYEGSYQNQGHLPQIAK